MKEELKLAERKAKSWKDSVKFAEEQGKAAEKKVETMVIACDKINVSVVRDKNRENIEA